MPNDSPRVTFVVRVRPGAGPTLENVATRERVALANLGEIEPRIKAWIAQADSRPGGDTIVERVG